MFINFNILYKSDISDLEFLLLLAIRDKHEITIKKYEDLLLPLQEKHYIELRKNKTWKLTKSGTEVLLELSQGEIRLEEKECFDSMVELYKKRGKETGILKSGEKRLIFLMRETGFKSNTILPVTER